MDQLDNLSRQKAAIEFLTRISSVPTLAINTDTVISSMLYDPGLDPVTSVKSHHSVISLHHSNSKEKSLINGIGQKDLRERDLTQQSRLTEELDKVQDFALSRKASILKPSLIKGNQLLNPKYSITGISAVAEQLSEAAIIFTNFKLFLHEQNFV